MSPKSSFSKLRSLHSEDRQPIGEVPAVYFVRPTEDNIKRICQVRPHSPHLRRLELLLTQTICFASCGLQDITNGLYDQIHLNFASSIPGPLLEMVAQTALERDAVSTVAKVHDLFLDFISMEDRLFQFEHEGSYIEFHDAATTEARAEANITKTVDALFSVVLTLGVVPIIRCPRRDSAELVATRLDAKIRDHLSTVGHMELSTGSGSGRPVLLIVDRNIDLSVMVSHSWSYQSLIHDLLPYNLNRVRLEVDPDPKATAASSEKVIKSFNLDSLEPFWAEHVSQPITTVIADIQAAVEEVGQRKKHHESRTSNLDNDADSTQVMNSTKSMSAYVAALPEIEERTRVLDLHTKIGKTLLNTIRDRSIDRYFAEEESIMTKPASHHKKEVLSLIQGTSGTAEDKLRLFMIYFLSKRHELDQSEIAEFEEALTKQGASVGPLAYLKQYALPYPLSPFFICLTSAPPQNSRFQ